MISGPITATTCPPELAEERFVIETYDSLNYAATVDRNPVPFLLNEDAAFELELARVRRIRMESLEWEPTTVRLLEGDREVRKEIVR